jgi:glyoxalase family protein
VQLTGIHHLTAISADARINLAFYTGILGMRLVKKSVNQDDVSAYHLFYADGEARPGTDLTFFDWPALPERRGGRSIVRTALRVASDSLLWWKRRFEQLHVPHAEIELRDDRATLDFEDPEGQRLSLIDDGKEGDGRPWDLSPVPAEHQIRGLGPITLSVPDLRPTDAVLTKVMEMRRVRRYAHSPEDTHLVHVYAMGEGGTGAELHVAVQPDLERARPGAGGVHHVAFRTPDDAQYEEWHERLTSLRIPNSGKIDRYYFRSLYFREPHGILFEIATDGPGFARDEAPDHLGERLALPPFLEGRRREIEAGLKPL